MVNDPITKIMRDASEIVRYDEVGIPLSIREGLLSAYPNHRALCHWHEDIEWVYIRSGTDELLYEWKTCSIKHR